MSAIYFSKQKYTKFQYKCRYCNRSISKQKKYKQFRIKIQMINKKFKI